MKNPKFLDPLSVFLFITARLLLILFGAFLLVPDWFPFSGITAYDITGEKWTIFSFIALLGGMSLVAKKLSRT